MVTNRVGLEGACRCEVWRGRAAEPDHGLVDRAVRGVLGPECHGGANDPTGQLSFNFVFCNRFDPVAKKPIAGGCSHPITNGTGFFTGARGLLTMPDSYNEAG